MLPSGDNIDHGTLIAALHEHLARKRLAVDAVGHWRSRETWQLATVTTDTIGRDFAFDYRHDKRINLGYINETLETIASQIEATRRAQMQARMVIHSDDPAGHEALARWIRAVLGRDALPHEIGALRHWLWTVKRSLAGYPVEHHLMLVFVGAQGAGKSRAIASLLAPLQELAIVPCDATLLVDQRWRPSLAKYVAGFWDELDGLEKSDRGALKQMLTATHMNYRPMRTTRVEAIPVLTRFIGASNSPVASLFRDPTGARRFYELKSAERCDWETINLVPYETLWASVDASAPAPILEHLGAIRGDQEGQRWRDTVGEWLLWEDWSTFQSTLPALHTAIDIEVGAPVDGFYQRYKGWCADTDEAHPLSKSNFGMRMQEENFEKVRPWAQKGTSRYWHYKKNRKAVHAVHAVHPEAGLDFGNSGTSTTADTKKGNELVPGLPGLPGLNGGEPSSNGHSNNDGGHEKNMHVLEQEELDERAAIQDIERAQFDRNWPERRDPG